MSAWDDPITHIRELEAEVSRLRKVVTAIKEAFGPEWLECGRLGLPCTSVSPADHWCLPCRVRAALEDRR